MFVYVRYARHTSQTKTNVSLVYMVLNGRGDRGDEHMGEPPPLRARMVQVSWIPILLLVYSMVAPASPRKMLGASLVAASLDPLGVWLAHLRGVAVPSPLQTFVMLLAQLCVRGAVDGAVALPANMGHKLTQGARAGQLRARPSCSGMAAWARCGRRSIACSRAKPPSSSFGPRCSAPAARPRQARLKRFEREAQATAALALLTRSSCSTSASPTRGIFYYVMELLIGRDLESLVREFGPLPRRRAGYLLRQVCHSLADAHARGHGSSRHQAGQHLCLPDGPRVRLREGARFRPRQGERPGVRRPGANADDSGPEDHRHAGLHGARDHPRRDERRSAGRCVRARLRRLLSADRSAGVRRPTRR